MIRDLNRLYRETPALHVKDCEPDGFCWLNGDPDQSTLGYARFGAEGDAPVVVMCNFTPVLRDNFRVGVPAPGQWEEAINTDSALYGGGNFGNLGAVQTEHIPCDGQPHSVTLTLPPLSVVVIRHKQTN